MTRLAFVSTAHIHTRGFLKTLAETQGAQCAAIWDDDAGRGEQYAGEFDVPFVADLDALLGDDRIDGFVICAENTRHMPLLEKTLPLGKPVMCEKPLATTVADARAIKALCARHGTTLTSGYFQPFNPANRAVKAMLSAGELGKVTHARFCNAHHAAYGRWFDSPALAWFADPALAGGGALMDMGAHAVHLLRHLCGPVQRVWGTTANVSGNYTDVDDYGMIQMRFADGTLGRVEAGWCFTGGSKGLEIIGSDAAVWQSDGRLVWGKPGEDARDVPPADARPDRIARLLAAIRGEVDADELADDLAASLDSVAIMDAAYKSAASGQWQNVEAL